jgi:UDP-N-acetylglucosamine acyltransferase
MPTIHPLSFVSPKANIADDVEIGPFCVVGPDVQLGAGCKLLPHATVTGCTAVGKNNIFHPHSVVGSDPQDLSYKNESTYLILGDNNTIRECVTINTGTIKDKQSGGTTRVGSNNLLMVNAHIGHDCQIGNFCVIANNVMFAGHVICGDRVVLNGAVGIHQFVTIGDYAYVAGAARIHHDVPPFVKIDGSDKIRGLNITGLQRAPGFPADAIPCLEEACRKLFYNKAKPIAVAMQEVEQAAMHPKVRELIDFLRRRDAGKNGRYLEAMRQK